MNIEIKADLIGSILDIGGGGEGVIGQVYTDRVVAIDNRREELEEAPDCCAKRLMDATELLFPDQSFDNVTFFYALMYMDADTQRKAIQEAVRVLRAGGTLAIWDCDIGSAYPEPFEVDLDITLEDGFIHTTYGIVKNDPQDFDGILLLLRQIGLKPGCAKQDEGHFYIGCVKN